VSEEDFLSFVENMNFKGKYFCVFNQDDIYDDGSETPALEQEILAEYLYFFEFDDDSLDKYIVKSERNFAFLTKSNFSDMKMTVILKRLPIFLKCVRF
jgi:hypothetical protein